MINKTYFEYDLQAFGKLHKEAIKKFSALFTRKDLKCTEREGDQYILYWQNGQKTVYRGMLAELYFVYIGIKKSKFFL